VSKPPQSDLPCNLEAEKYVLGACLKSKKNCSDAVSKLTAQDFTTDPNRVIFQRIWDMAKKGIEVDRITLVEGLVVNGEIGKNGLTLSYVVDLDDKYPGLENIHSWIAILKDKSTLRKLILLGSDMVRRATQQEPPRDIILSTERILGGTFRVSSESGPERLSQIIAKYPVDELLDPSKRRGTPIETGFRALDELTGGIFPTEKWIFGASPGVGKTAIATQIMLHNAKRGIPVVMFSLEMSKRALFNRMVCQIAEVPIMRFRTGNLGGGERTKLIEATGLLNDLPVFIDEKSSITTEEMKTHLRRLTEEHGIELAIADFLQKIRAAQPRSNLNEQLTGICSDIHDMAKDYVPWVLLSQLSRYHKRTGQKPDLEDLGNSGAIEQLGNVILFPYRESLEKNKASDPSLKGKAEFLVKKNREGEIQNIPMRWIGWLMAYSDVAPVGKDDDGDF
jgi:replicative DNA helicase